MAAAGSADVNWPVTQVIYQGFVHTDMDGEDEPSYDEVLHVNDIFAKHSLKDIRKQHPLFARGSDDKLNFVLKVDVLQAESKSGAPLFETNVHKIVYVAPIKKTLYIILRRSALAGRFSCHLFKITSEKLAEELSSMLWVLIKAAPKDGTMARHSSSGNLKAPTSPMTVMRARALTDAAFTNHATPASDVRPQSSSSPALAAPAASPPRKSYEMFSPLGKKGGDKSKLQTVDLRVADSKPQPASHSNWLCEGMSRKGAEDILDSKAPGTFLVRPSETQAGAYSLSLVLRDGSVNHFKMCFENGHYFMLGDDLLTFPTLDKAISFYYTHQITKYGDHLICPYSI